MSALYSWLKPDHGKIVTRRAHRDIRAKVASWEGAVSVDLDNDGYYRVTVGPHPTSGDTGSCIVVAQGSVIADKRHEITNDL